MPVGVGADAEVGGVAEGDEPGIADEQVQARGEQRPDRDVVGEEGVVARARRGHEERGDQDEEPPRRARISMPASGSSARHRRPAVAVHPRGHQRPAEEAPRPDDEHGGHEGEDREDREARDEQDPEGQHLAVDERAEEGAPERAEPADHDDDERLDDHLGVHAGHDGLDRRHQRAAEPAEERADHEDAGVEPVDVDAERAQRLAVERGGADEAARPRAVQHEPEGERDARGRGAG